MIIIVALVSVFSAAQAKQEKAPSKGLLFFYRTGRWVDNYLTRGIDTNYIALPEETTQWNDDFTVDDYHELVRRIYDGELIVDNSIDAVPETSVSVNVRQGSIV